MKREYRPRPTTAQDIAREFAKGLPLEEQLVVSVFLAKLEAAATKQATDAAADGVIVTDFQRKWHLEEL